MQRRRTRHPDADGGDLAFGPAGAARHPHPGPPVDPDRVQAQVGAHLDQRFFKAPNVIDHIERFSQSDDRVADQLSGTVPSDLAAAVGVDDWSAVNWSLVRLSAPSGGVDRRVLQ
jgi:hypothetical protein